MNAALEGQFPWYVVWLLAAVGYIFIAYAIAAIVYVVFYKVLKKHVEPLKINVDYATRKILRHELSYSFTTLFIHACFGGMVFWFHSKGWSMVYTDLAEYGYIYFFVSLILIVLLHDTYFYWTHRLMHMKSLYPIIHKAHHVSINPSPFAAYSAHPTEALIAGLFFPIIVFILPCHWLALAIFVLYMLFMSVMGHAGYEFYPRGFSKSWFGKWHTTATHHLMHHKNFNGNYGIYFSFWDKLMKTEQKDYHQQFEQVFVKNEK